MRGQRQSASLTPNKSKFYSGRVCTVSPFSSCIANPIQEGGKAMSRRPSKHDPHQETDTLEWRLKTTCGSEAKPSASASEASV
jgi:hypothetical protein